MRAGFSLSPIAAQAGYRLEDHASVSSTNLIALEHARAGDPGNIWIVSKKQEAGRGRRGRVWETPEGNLAATLLLVLKDGHQQAATLGFVAGLAMSEALEAVAPRANLAVAADAGGTDETRFALKWPNDVLTDGAKLAGILLESNILANGVLAIAVGIGVNVVAAPKDTPYPATSLAEVGSPCDAETVFLALSDAWVANVRLWNNGSGLDAVRRKWLTKAAGLGSEVAVRIDGEIVRGLFETIDDECRFVIRQSNGRMISIAAGDVHFGAVASARAE